MDFKSTLKKVKQAKQKAELLKNAPPEPTKPTPRRLIRNYSSNKAPELNGTFTLGVDDTFDLSQLDSTLDENDYNGPKISDENFEKLVDFSSVYEDEHENANSPKKSFLTKNFTLSYDKKLSYRPKFLSPLGMSKFINGPGPVDNRKYVEILFYQIFSSEFSGSEGDLQGGF